MARLAGEGGVGKHHPATPPSNTTGLPSAGVEDRLAQADMAVTPETGSGPCVPARAQPGWVKEIRERTFEIVYYGGA